MTKDQERRVRLLASSSIVGGDIRAALDELDELRRAAEPFVKLLRSTSGGIPTERLSFMDWKRLDSAWNQSGGES